RGRQFPLVSVASLGELEGECGACSDSRRTRRSPSAATRRSAPSLAPPPQAGEGENGETGGVSPALRSRPENGTTLFGAGHPVQIRLVELGSIEQRIELADLRAEVSLRLRRIELVHQPAKTDQAVRAGWRVDEAEGGIGGEEDPLLRHGRHVL